MPHFGGAYTDFVDTYGQPWRAAGTHKNFWIDRGQGMWISVSLLTSLDRVASLTVIGDASWDREQTETYCKQFLPSDAVKFNRVETATDTLINYHSSVGDVIMRIADQGMCTLNGVPSC